MWRWTAGMVTTVCRLSITDTRSPPRYLSAYVNDATHTNTQYNMFAVYSLLLAINIYTATLLATSVMNKYSRLSCLRLSNVKNTPAEQINYL